jgi:hypothetical protein
MVFVLRRGAQVQGRGEGCGVTSGKGTGCAVQDRRSLLFLRVFSLLGSYAKVKYIADVQAPEKVEIYICSLGSASKCWYKGLLNEEGRK